MHASCKFVRFVSSCLSRASGSDLFIKHPRSALETATGARWPGSVQRMVEDDRSEEPFRGGRHSIESRKVGLLTLRCFASKYHQNVRVKSKSKSRIKIKIRSRSRTGRMSFYPPSPFPDTSWQRRATDSAIRST